MTTYIDDCRNVGITNYSTLVPFENMFASRGQKNLHSRFLNQMNQSEFNTLRREQRFINREANHLGWRDRLGGVLMGGVTAMYPAFSFYVLSPITATVVTGSSFLLGLLGGRQMTRNYYAGNAVNTLAPSRVQRLELKIDSIQRRINRIQTFCFWNIFFSYDKELQELKTAKAFFRGVHGRELLHVRVNHRVHE